ncbi:MAG: hypothetical protein HFI08_03635 [Bacilli bacterium]|nr:hypothetical protein [Bacilli bacterium]
MNYYVFICLDSIPILETILNEEKEAVEDFEQIDWYQTKYIILDFKSVYSKKNKTIEKGNVSYKNKILTKQISYYRIDILKAKKDLETKVVFKHENDLELIKFTNAMFIDNSSSFLTFIKTRKILREKEIEAFEKAFQKQIVEEKILDTWKNINKS